MDDVDAVETTSIMAGEAGLFFPAAQNMPLSKR
jgi:hypothetical protein